MASRPLATFTPANIGAGVATRAPARDLPRLYINGRFLTQQTTGVQRAAREIVFEIDRLLQRGRLAADVTLLVPPGPWVQRLSTKRITVETIGTMRGVLWEQLSLPKRASGGTLLSLGNSAPIRALLDRDTRVAVMIHDVSFLDFPGAYKRAYRMGHSLMLPVMMRRADTILTVSQTERERLVRMGPATPIVVAPNGGWRGEPTRFGEVPSLPDTYGLYVGSFSLRKNFPRTLEAAIRLAREDGLHSVFVGTAGRIMRKPRFEIPADVADRIHLIGQINDPGQLAQIYRGARVLLFPSLYEACPLPPAEAAHFGCPAVVSNIPAIWERCGRGAAYCDPASVDSILDAVRSVIDETPARARAIAAGWAHSDNWSWSDQAALVCASALGSACLLDEPATLDDVDFEGYAASA
ncbi:glycosyltransferase family 4 protein [Novosphingobium guangzhouense]|uniref:Glycosyl transferase n=1 Tax=Novosphingobium guangzhouense TaxID=1850347 RepID=A0A2K2G170_9SPHN|nr:glycosyltransferase family 1 protein [Novosphingobium guangzhouense]PNU04791.1 glycosyl transferase [Novosphingobium guangzhouense]